MIENMNIDIDAAVLDINKRITAFVNTHEDRPDVIIGFIGKLLLNIDLLYRCMEASE